ncbi:MAG: hypothetical protein C3F10_04775 [Dehalococcoidia bacterium]|nr:MAG: hypothetical protein C3F10_04775 [Dehalococcoidia bacterium]
MSKLPIPATMAEVTPEWLTASLRQGGCIREATVAAAPRVQIGQGVGILGELARVTLEYDRDEPGAPKTLIAKIPTADPGGRGIAQMLGFYEKECRFYSEVGDRVGIRTAHRYYADRDPENVQYIILMEDLGGLAIGDQVAGATVDECRLVVTEVAKLHAKWWASPELGALNWIPFGNDPIIKFAALSYAQSLEPFLQNFGDHLTGEQHDMALKFLPRMNPMQDNFVRAPYTLCHGDLRLDNVFWGSPDNTSAVTLVDWQIAIKARGIYDIGYFMSQSVDPEIRATCEENLIRDYLRALKDHGVKDYAFDQAWDDYRLTTMFCFTYPVTSCGSIDLANERGLQLAMKMLDRSLSAITDLKAYDVLDRFEPAPLPEPPQ